MPADAAVILAAGKGTRMKSDRAKVLHELDGRPLLAHVLEAVRPLELARTVVVVGHQAERVEALCREFGVETVLQAEQLGTGHAVQQARARLEDGDGHTLVLCGDVPLLRTETTRRLLEDTREGDAAGAVLTAMAVDPTGYGRILRDAQGRVTGIVEERDATDEQRRIREYNTGTYCFENRRLWEALDRVGRENAQGEFYLTDVIGILVAAGRHVEGVLCADEREVQGVNTLMDLERAARDREAMRRG